MADGQPSFQDFMLDFEDKKGNRLTSDEYLENVLTTSDCPELCRAIQVMFPLRHCAALMRPCDDDRDVKSLCTGQAAVRPEFEKQARKFRESLFESVR